MDAIQLIKRGDAIELRQALDAGLDSNYSNGAGTTLLILAATEGNTAMAGLLIDRGADLERENQLGFSALLSAAWFNHPKVIRLLLQRGASLDRIRDQDFGWMEAHCGITREEMLSLRALREI